jgi:hypothetical protein
MTDPSDASAEPDFYATAERWLTKGIEVIDHPDQAHNYLLAGVGYALLAAVQMDRRHSAAINRRLTERENRPESLPRPVRRGRHPRSPG